jgi:hypothetical protein
MGLLSERFEIELAVATAELGSQRRKARRMNSPGAQYEAVWSLFQLQMITGFDS